MSKNKKRKFRVYVHFETVISTVLEAKDKEEAKAIIDAEPIEITTMNGREYYQWECHGGVQKVREIVKETREAEI